MATDPRRPGCLAPAAEPADGRWQRGEVVEGLYLAESPETAWAEWYRYLAEVGLPAEQALPRELWRWEITLSEVADLRTDSDLGRVGLRRPKPTRDDWPSFQSVGEALFGEGWPAVIAPSAARPEGGQVLCLFRTSKELPDVSPVPPPETHDQPPVVPPGLRT